MPVLKQRTFNKEDGANFRTSLRITETERDLIHSVCIHEKKSFSLFVIECALKEARKIKEKMDKLEQTRQRKK